MEKYKLRDDIRIHEWSNQQNFVIEDPVTGNYFEVDEDAAKILKCLSTEPRDLFQIQAACPNVGKEQIKEFVRKLNDSFVLEKFSGSENKEASFEKKVFTQLEDIIKNGTRSRSQRRTDDGTRNIVNSIINLISLGKVNQALSFSQNQYKSTGIAIFNTLSNVIVANKSKPNFEKVIIKKLEQKNIYVSKVNRRSNNEFFTQLFEVGLQNIKSSRFDEALSVFNRICRLQPENKRASFFREALIRGFAENLKESKINILQIKLPIGNPEKLIGFLTKYLKVFLELKFMIPVAAMSLFCVVYFSQNLLAYLTLMLEHVQFWHYVFAVGYILFVASIHEIAHAVCCTMYGGVVKKFGLLFMFFAPSVYVDLSSSWFFSEKKKRVHVLVSGPFVDLFFTAVGLLGVHVYYDNSYVLSTCFFIGAICSGMMLIGNLVPFIRYDGYYILSELTGLPNLKSESKKIFGELFSNKYTTLQKGFLVSYYFSWAFYLGAIFLCLTLYLATYTYDKLGAFPAVVITAILLGYFIFNFLSIISLKKTTRVIKANLLKSDVVKLVAKKAEKTVEKISLSRKNQKVNLSVCKKLSAVSSSYKNDCVIFLKNNTRNKIFPYSKLMGEVEVFKVDNIKNIDITMGSDTQLNCRKYFNRDYTALSDKQKFWYLVINEVEKKYPSNKYKLCYNNDLCYMNIIDCGFSAGFLRYFNSPDAFASIQKNESFIVRPRKAYPALHVPLVVQNIFTGDIVSCFFTDEEEAKRFENYTRGVSLSEGDFDRLSKIQKEILFDIKQAAKPNHVALAKWRDLSKKSVEKYEMCLIDDHQWPVLYQKWIEKYSTSDLVVLGLMTQLVSGELHAFFTGTLMLFPIYLEGNPLFSFRYRLIDIDSTLDQHLLLLSGTLFAQPPKYNTAGPAFWLKNAQFDLNFYCPIYPKPPESIDKLLLVEGELKAMVSEERLNTPFYSIWGIAKFDLSSIINEVARINVNEIYIIMDRDNPEKYIQARIDGVSDSDRFSYYLAKMIELELKKNVKVILLPLVGEKYDIESYALDPEQQKKTPLNILMSNALSPDEFAKELKIDTKNFFKAYIDFKPRYDETMREYGISLNEQNRLSLKKAG